MVDEGDDEKFKGLKERPKTLLKVCVWVDLYMGFVNLHFKRKYPDFWEFRKTATIH
jgi:hypothetical protein